MTLEEESFVGGVRCLWGPTYWKSTLADAEMPEEVLYCVLCHWIGF